jgi:hypothetical protein
MSPPDGEGVPPAGSTPKTINPSEPIAKRGFQLFPGWGMIAGPFAMATAARLRLMGPPVSRHKQRRLGIERFVPGLGYGKRSCSRCQKHLWLGPKQLARLEAEPEIEVICTICILPELKAGLKDGTLALTHLGGRGGGYYQNGKYIGPPEEFRN